MLDVEAWLDPVTGDTQALKLEAENADLNYLRSLEHSVDEPKDEVMAAFAIARALAALVWTTVPDPLVAVFEGVYELSVISEADEATLLTEVAQALE